MEAAAAQARTNLSDFMRRKALEAAEMEVLDNRRVVISVANWEKVEAWAHAPAREITELRTLAASRPPWQD